jgi:tetratricopeptide (TPR) repeat protein
MEFRGESVALYGRFSPGARDRLSAEIVRRGGAVARDFTRRSTLLVIGSLATSLIDGGQLASRLAAARTRAAPVFAERRFEQMLREGLDACTLPLASAETQSGFSRSDIEVFAAFDIVRIEDEKCRFVDATTLKAAARLVQAGRSLSDAVRIMARARDLAPKGPWKIVLDSRGQAALQWEHGLTTLEGQFYLPFDEDAATVEDMFEAAALAEDAGDFDEAARLYDMSARVDRTDPIAPFNLGNVRLKTEACDQAVMAYRQALARDPGFVEARYNLSQAYEFAGRPDAARQELVKVLEIEPGYGDALFNLAQLELKRGALAQARALYDAYLASDPPAEWAAKARRALTYCIAQLSA